MNLQNSSPFTVGRDIQTIYETIGTRSGFALTLNDRLGIEKLLRAGVLMRTHNASLIAGLLRHKLRTSRGAVEPVAPSLVISGCRVTYRIADEPARTGALAMTATPMPGCITVASLLGATMIGMQALQTVPLIRDTHEIVTLTVLDVAPPPDEPLSA